MFKSLINELSRVPENLDWKNCKRFPTVSENPLLPPFLSIWVFFSFKENGNGRWPPLFLWNVLESQDFAVSGVLALWVAMRRGGREEGSARKQRVLKAGPKCKRLNGHAWFAEYLIIRQISPRSVTWVSVTLAVQMRWDFHKPPLNEFSNDIRQKSFFSLKHCK